MGALDAGPALAILPNVTCRLHGMIAAEACGQGEACRPRPSPTPAGFTANTGSTDSCAAAPFPMAARGLYGVHRGGSLANSCASPCLLPYSSASIGVLNITLCGCIHSLVTWHAAGMQTTTAVNAAHGAGVDAPAQTMTSVRRGSCRRETSSGRKRALGLGPAGPSARAAIDVSRDER